MCTVSKRLYIGLHGVTQSEATCAAAAPVTLVGMRGTVSYGTQGDVPTEQRQGAANHAG